MYCALPDAVALNYDLNRAVGFDETGFLKTAGMPYRTQGWDFFSRGAPSIATSIIPIASPIPTARPRSRPRPAAAGRAA